MPSLKLTPQDHKHIAYVGLDYSKMKKEDTPIFFSLDQLNPDKTHSTVEINFSVQGLIEFAEWLKSQAHQRENEIIQQKASKDKEKQKRKTRKAKKKSNKGKKK